ncbi:hypothetical protein BLNAU_13321 [Blattamonas nauphoetae]|uniref:Uncharacterized protein n=1 Tax=Blattamonas nauphoetae TaxID=2049346 RepID=A0ABQ9XIZ5_9EUKA|nr:hypothetical protein BLNAU_13321 [Blattamonas nauphoetae]
MSSFRDIQNFVGSCLTLSTLMEHKRFLWSLETAMTNRQGTKLIIYPNFSEVWPTLSVQNQSQLSMSHRPYIAPTPIQISQFSLAGQIESATLLFKDFQNHDLSSIWCWCALWVDGLGGIRKSILPVESKSEYIEKRSKEWFGKITIPSLNCNFKAVFSDGNNLLVEFTTGEIDVHLNTWQKSNFSLSLSSSPLFPSFQNVATQTRVGPSRLKQVSFEFGRFYLLFDNGCAYEWNEDIDEAKDMTEADSYETYTEGGDMPIKITKDDEEFSFGLFGNSKPTRYFEGYSTFLCEDKSLLKRLLGKKHRRFETKWVKVSTEKTFEGRTPIQLIRTQNNVLYLFDDGHFLITRDNDFVATFFEDFNHPVFVSWKHHELGSPEYPLDLRISNIAVLTSLFVSLDETLMLTLHGGGTALRFPHPRLLVGVPKEERNTKFENETVELTGWMRQASREKPGSDEMFLKTAFMVNTHLLTICE